MNWFKANPFLGGLTILTTLAAAAGLYFVAGQHAAFIEQSDAYANNVSTLNNLQSAKPFPDDANLQAAQAEDKRAAEVFSGLASAVAGQSAPRDNSLSPQQFQDKLSEAASDALAKAQAGGIALPEDFYLGFAQYKTQPPTAAAAPVPKRFISRPVARHCTSMVRMPTVRSIVAKIRVRTAGSSEAEATICACSK